MVVHWAAIESQGCVFFISQPWFRSHDNLEETTSNSQSPSSTTSKPVVGRNAVISYAGLTLFVDRIHGNSSEKPLHLCAP